MRQSPFNAKGLRQTGFAGVEVMPLLGEDADVSLDIPERDIELSFMRCGGKGGQKVNKVETGRCIVKSVVSVVFLWLLPAACPPGCTCLWVRRLRVD